MAISVQELPALFDMTINSTKEYVVPGKIASAEIKISNISISIICCRKIKVIITFRK
jgi:hypothetical protein